jgi:hypothetical protein
LVQILPKISLLVQQTDADQWNTKVARRLQVISGQYTESTREDRQTFSQAELCREIGYG